MAWEICISQDGWDDILKELHDFKYFELIDAISDNYFEKLEEYSSTKNILQKVGSFIDYLSTLEKEILINIAYSLVITNNTCDNGGYSYWIDKQGYHKVILKYKG